MLALVYALVNAPHVGWDTARTIGELAGALVLIVLFLFNEQRHHNPLVPLSMFKIKGLGAADVTQILALAGFYTMFFFITLYMQEVLHYSAIRTGLCYLPVTVGAALGAGVATYTIPKVGTRPLIVTGSLLGAAGVFWLSRIPVDGTYWSNILGGLIIMGAGVGLGTGRRSECRQWGCAGRQGWTRRVADHRVFPARRRVGAGGLHLARHEPHQPPTRDAHPTVRGAHARLPTWTPRRQHRTGDRRRDRGTSPQRASRRSGPRCGRRPGRARARGRLDTARASTRNWLSRNP